MLTDQEKGIGVLAWTHLREAAKALPAQFSADITLSRPKVVRGDADGLQRDLSWPLVALTLQVEGDLDGRMTLLVSLSDALALVALKRGEALPEADAMLPLDEESQETLKSLLQSLCASGERALRTKGRKNTKLEILAAQEINKSWELAEDGVTVEGWVATADLAVGTHPAMKLSLWVPDSLSNLMAAELGEAQDDVAEDKARFSHGGDGGNKGKILIVDDVAVTRTLIRQNLENEGYTVVEAESGEVALRKVAETHPTLILLDLGLPGISGYDVCRTLKESSALASVPVVVCSASAHKQDIIKAVQSGANDYIVKPFETQTLLQKVAGAIDAAGKVA